MSKKRVFELAKDIGISSKELIEELHKINIDVKSHMSTIADVEIILDKLTVTEKTQEKAVITEVKVMPKPDQPLAEKKEEEKVEKQIEVKPQIQKPVLRVNESITTLELAKKIGVNPSLLIKKLIEMGKMVTINQALDNDIVTIVALEYGYLAEIVPIFEDEAVLLSETYDSSDEVVLSTRPPIITMMGHVDHGKTSLLDAIRKTNVTATESGGITQHIGAYTIKLEKGNVVFLDTPGHEAFTAMRARGAKVTDIVVLVVAADDGVMPQTLEAIDHAKEAGVSIIVAINKIDKPEANPEKVKQELSKHGLIPEEWGGKTIFVEVSAKKGTGLDNLLEMFILQAEILELTASSERHATGTIIEARLDKGRGPVATVLIKDGTLKLQDNFVSGLTYGKVKAMINDRGERIKSAGPSTPVEVLGFSDVTLAGDKFIVVKDEKIAKDINLKRKEKEREKKINPPKHISLDDLYNEIQKGKIKELKIIIKTDVSGSIEPLKESLSRISNEKVKLVNIHSGVGNVNASDVMLAAASNAIIIGFHVKIEDEAEKFASSEGVYIKLYEIIYEVTSDIKLAMEGLLEPATKEVITGRAEVRKIIKLTKETVVIGSMVISGKIIRSDNIRIIRKGGIIFTGKISSLRRFKEDVKDVNAGYECGIGIDNFTNLSEQDIIEAFTIEKVKQKL